MSFYDDNRDYEEEAHNRRLLNSCPDCEKSRDDCTCRECRTCGAAYDIERDNHAAGECPTCADASEPARALTPEAIARAVKAFQEELTRSAPALGALLSRCADCGGTGCVPSIESSEYEICPTCKDVT